MAERRESQLREEGSGRNLERNSDGPCGWACSVSYKHSEWDKSKCLKIGEVGGVVTDTSSEMLNMDLNE